MDSVIVDNDFPHDLIRRGARDERRHNKKVQEAARKQLKDIISRQDIITTSGNKKIKVKLKYLDSYHFRHYPDRVDVIGRDEYEELDKDEIISRPNDGNAGGAAGNAEGDEIYEVEFTIDDLTNMMIEELRLPRLDERVKSEIVSEVIEWTDRRKSSGVHALIDKKHTLLANIKRKAAMGYKPGEKAPIVNDDLRFRAWKIQKEKHSNAVIFFLLDRSGSMSEEKIYSVKAFFFWVTQFLRKRYDRIEIKFIAHDVAARELPESDFFTITDSGGTMVSAAYQLCADLIKFNYPSSKWNIYCFHASDGDTWGDDDKCAQLIQEILSYGAKMFGYVEVRGEFDTDNITALWNAIENVDDERVILSTINSVDEVLETIEFFFGPEGLDSKKHAVR